MPEIPTRRPLTANDETLPLAALSDTGLLWLINRVVFHPRGFALALDVDRETGVVRGWGLDGDGSEPVHFADESDDKHFADAEAFLDQHRAHP